MSYKNDPPKRAAAIDIGSNSVKLWAAERKKKDFPKTLDEQIEITGLGKNLEEKGMLLEKSIHATVKTVKTFADRARELDCEKIVVGATSAVRRASNKSTFLHRIRKECGLSVKILSGEDEAILTFIGVTYNRKSKEKQGRKGRHWLTFDLGGGSTEVTLGQSARPEFYQSLPIGSVSFYEERGWDGTLNRSRLRNGVDKAASKIKKFGDNLYNQAHAGYFTAMGIGGTVATLAMVDQEMTEFDRERIEGYTLEKATLMDLLYELGRMSPRERVEQLHIKEGRKEYILGGAVILAGLMRFYELEEIMTTVRGLRHGLLIGTLT